MSEVIVEHGFHAVGQGIFGFGLVSVEAERAGAPHSPSFAWVYDCGTRSGAALRSKRIQQHASKLQGRELDLLTISHFHADHINGVVELLNAVKTKTVMLPWAPLWRRLVIGFEQGLDAADAAFGFYVSPVTYLAQQAPERFERVVFVMPGVEGPPPAEEGPRPEPFTEGPMVDFGDQVKGKSLSDEMELPTPDEESSRIQVMRLDAHRAVQVGGFWEFVPYNDPKTRPDDIQTFQNRVERLKIKLLNGDKVVQTGALSELRHIYRTTFGAAKQNDVSLLMFAGPIGSWDTLTAAVSNGGVYCHLGDYAPSVCSILYTGDANMSAVCSWEAVERHLSTRRCGNLGTFQVPHHGSRHSWHQGFASRVRPRVTVFNADPSNSYGHPHAEVWRDFLNLNCFLVDKHDGFEFSGRLG